MNKHEILNDWVLSINQNGINQHSAEWYNERTDTIGGSSIGTIIGVDKYCSLRQFIHERVENAQYTKLCMNWGTLFEDTLRTYTERVFNCKILADNVFIKHNKYITYSPDGLAVVGHPHFDSDKVVLFEFKCPYSRKFSTAVDAKYVAQVQMGLDLIDVSDCGILVQGWFKKASIDDLSAGIHSLCNGAIGFYCTIPLCDHVQDILNGKRIPVDLNTASDNVLNFLIECTIGPSRSVTVVSISGVSPDNIIQELLNKQQTENVLIGYLPWYLQNYSYDNIDKISGFVQSHTPIIELVVDTIVKCKKIMNAAIVDSNINKVIETIYADFINCDL